MKKVLALSLCVAVTASSLLAGCSKKPEEKKPQYAKAAQSSIVTEAGTFPVTKEKSTLKVLIPQSTFVQDYTTNEFTKLYEEKTNVHVDWNIIAGSGDQITQKISMILASGSDYPDVIISNLNKAQTVVYGTQGVLLPLNSFIDKYALHLKKAFAEDDFLRRSSIYTDGNIYFFPKLTYVYHQTLENKMWVNQSWMDKLGLKAPGTTDDFYQMLKAFKEKDPNGNGKADEVAMASQGVKGTNGMVRYLMSAFTTPEGYYVDNGKVKYAPANPEYKDGLKYIKKLYDEGLIAKDSLTMDRKQITAMAETPGASVLGASPALWYGMFTTNNAPSGRYKEYTSIPPVKGPKGVQMSMARQENVGVLGVVTKSCKYPEIATRWIDWFYSMEGNLTAAWGPEDKGWRKGKPEEKGIDGGPALYAYLGNQQFGQNQNAHWSSSVQAYESVKFRMGLVATDPNETEPRLYKETKEKYEKYKVDNGLPFLYMSEQDTQDSAQLDVLISKAWEEGLAQVIAAGKDVDKEWDTMIDNINKIGLKKSIDLRQKAYDEYVKSTKK